MLKATTRERWRYWDRALRPGQRPGPTFVAEMAMEYDLVREQGTWKMASARTLSNEYLEPRGWKPEVRHGHGGEASGGGPAPSQPK